MPRGAKSPPTTIGIVGVATMSMMGVAMFGRNVIDRRFS